MAAAARHREALLARAIFRFHPDLCDAPVLIDPLELPPGHPHFASPSRPCLEGGDVLVLSPDVIAVGHSERTNRAGIQALARALARTEGGPRWMVVVEVPHRRAYMHLDTLLTPVDRDACLLYPPVLMPGGGGEEARVYEIDLHAAGLQAVARDDLLAALRTRGIDLEPIPCGGEDPVTQQREQWTDGANALALAPGVITLYDRNVGTAEELARCGFRVVEAEALLLGRDEVDLDEDRRVCILVPSHEISRARGGPHCLTHPLVRD
jgi:arginine deiminase